MQFRTFSNAIAGLVALSLSLACGDEEKPNNDPLTVPVSEDQGLADASVTDARLPEAAQEPRAQVYLNDPVTDSNMLTEVILDRPTSEDGRLTSNWVQVFNCLNEAGGLTAMPDFLPIPLTVNLCHEVQVVRPDADGHYLSILPPEDDTDPNDTFAEVMMYHHVNLAHDYFNGNFGFEALDFALPALVNVQFQTEPPLPFLQPDPEGWVPLANAAFFPKESWREFAAQFGLPPRDTDSIIFFQGDKDFAYDSRVIYHEYTHAVVGTSRLQVPAVLDQFGLDNSPRSMNEGIADYFAASLANDPRVGRYVGVMGLGLRDLSSFRACPDDTEDEVHAQGEIIGSALWSLRSELGAELADEIAFRSLERFGIATTHNLAGEILLDQAAQIDSTTEEKARAILERHGLLSCERSRPFVNFNAATSRARLPHFVEGKSTSGVPGLNTVVPAYKQFYIEGEAEAAVVKLSWSLSAGGGFTGQGGQVVALKAAYNREAPVFLDTTGNRLSIESEFEFEPALSQNKQTLILAADCFPDENEKAHLLFLNPGNDQIQITNMKIEYLAEVPSDATVERCTSDPVDPSPTDSGLEMDFGTGDAGIDETGDSSLSDVGASDAFTADGTVAPN